MAETGDIKTDDVRNAVEPASVGRTRLTVPLLLATGWGALFSFMAMVLMDDGPAVPEPAVAPAGMVAKAATFEIAAGVPTPSANPRPRPHWREPGRVVALPVVDGPSGETPEEFAQDAAKASDVPSSATGLSPTAERADYIGTWGPTASACSAPSRRRGYLPAILTQDGARAGRTLCRFSNGRRDGQGWALAAECSERGRRWTSQVRLVVDGNRLTWTSAKGASSYVRCGRRDG